MHTRKTEYHGAVRMNFKVSLCKTKLATDREFVDLKVVQLDPELLLARTSPVS